MTSTETTAEMACLFSPRVLKIAPPPSSFRDYTVDISYSTPIIGLSAQPFSEARRWQLPKGSFCARTTYQIQDLSEIMAVAKGHRRTLWRSRGWVAGRKTQALAGGSGGQQSSCRNYSLLITSVMHVFMMIIVMS